VGVGLPTAAGSHFKPSYHSAAGGSGAAGFLESRRPLSRKVGRKSGALQRPTEATGANERNEPEFRSCAAHAGDLFDGTNSPRAAQITDKAALVALEKEGMQPVGGPCAPC
jgi:hypothetical protein